MTSLFSCHVFKQPRKFPGRDYLQQPSGNSKLLQRIQRFQNSGILFYKNSCVYWCQQGVESNDFFFLFDKYTFSEIYCFQVDFKLLKTEIIFCIALTYQCLYLHHHYWKRTAWLLQDTLLKWRFWPRWVLKIQTNTNMTENIYQLGRKTIFIFLFFCSIGDHFNCFCFLQFVL